MHDIIDYCTIQLFYVKIYLKREWWANKYTWYYVLQKSLESPVWSAWFSMNYSIVERGRGRRDGTPHWSSYLIGGSGLPGKWYHS